MSKDIKRDEVIEHLTKKYYLKITNECVELSPKIEDCFEIRNAVISNLYKDLVEKKRR